METAEHPAPRTTIRYDGAHGRTTAVVLKDSSILEVKRDGTQAKNHYATYGGWLATLPEGAAGALTMDTNPTRSTATSKFAGQPEPTSDIEWMRRVYCRVPDIGLGNSLNEVVANAKRAYDTYKSVHLPHPDILAQHETYYERAKARVDMVGGPDSEKAKKRKMYFRAKPLWILSADGGKPEALQFGRTTSWNYATQTTEYSDPLFFYKGKQGTTFAEVGIPVGADGWPNLWRIRGNEFKAVAKPVL